MLGQSWPEALRRRVDARSTLPWTNNCCKPTTFEGRLYFISYLSKGDAPRCKSVKLVSGSPRIRLWTQLETPPCTNGYVPSSTRQTSGVGCFAFMLPETTIPPLVGADPQAPSQARRGRHTP